MKFYSVCYHANYETHEGKFWANSRHDVEKMILSLYPNATDVQIWV